MKVGFVSLVGNTNAGKSTLLNAILGTKLVITSSKPQTTRVNIRGVYNDKDSQIVFVDTPGFHKPTKMLGKIMMKEVSSTLRDPDIELTVLVVDGKDYLVNKNNDYFKMVKSKNLLIVLNKIDLLYQEEVIKIRELLDVEFPKIEVIETVAKDKFNIDVIIKTIKKYLTEGEPFYPDDMICDHPLAFMAAEIVREKVMRLTDKEIPHSIATVTKSFENEEKLLTIKIDIIVERESQKPIIIGKDGAMIKKISTFARKDIETLAGKPVDLETYVRVKAAWRDDNTMLKEFGFKK